MSKSSNHKGPENKNTIKHRYFAKLAIPNENSLKQSVFVPSPPKILKTDDANKFDDIGLTHKKSLSSKNIASDMLNFEIDDERRPSSDIDSPLEMRNNLILPNEEAKETHDDLKINDRLIDFDKLGSIYDEAAPLNRSSTLNDSSKLSSSEPSEVIKTSFATKESGNWRLDLVEKASFARSADRIRHDLLSKLTYQKIWLTPKDKPDSHQTVFIYDWDDTLL